MDLDMSLRGAQRRSNLNPTGGRLLRFVRNDMEKAPRLKTPSLFGGAVWNFGFSAVSNLFGIWCLEFGISGRFALYAGQQRRSSE